MEVQKENKWLLNWIAVYTKPMYDITREVKLISTKKLIKDLINKNSSFNSAK